MIKITIDCHRFAVWRKRHAFHPLGAEIRIVRQRNDVRRLVGAKVPERKLAVCAHGQCLAIGRKSNGMNFLACDRAIVKLLLLFNVDHMQAFASVRQESGIGRQGDRFHRAGGRFHLHNLLTGQLAGDANPSNILQPHFVEEEAKQRHGTLTSIRSGGVDWMLCELALANQSAGFRFPVLDPTSQRCHRQDFAVGEEGKRRRHAIGPKTFRAQAPTAPAGSGSPSASRATADFSESAATAGIAGHTKAIDTRAITILAHAQHMAEAPKVISDSSGEFGQSIPLFAAESESGGILIETLTGCVARSENLINPQPSRLLSTQPSALAIMHLSHLRPTRNPLWIILHHANQARNV